MEDLFVHHHPFILSFKLRKNSTDLWLKNLNSRILQFPKDLFQTVIWQWPI